MYEYTFKKHLISLQITQLKIKYNPFAKGFRGPELYGSPRRYMYLHACNDSNSIYTTWVSHSS